MKILVVGPSWVGDMMMSQSLYRTLKARYPQAIIDVMAPAWCRPLLSRMPEVNEAIPMPLGHGALELGERRKLGHSLREKRYDRAYVLPNSFKSALVPFFAGIPHRTGWRGEMRYGLLNDARVLDKAAWPLMVERYVAGRELTCGVIGDFVTDIIEIVPRDDLPYYDFTAKYAPGGSRHELPAKISPDVYQNIRRLTLLAHRALGCRGVSRADFRLDDTPGGTGELVCLEVNTQPGMTATSLVPELAGHAGWSFGELVRWMVEDASCNR